MMLRRLHATAAVLFVAAIVVQVFLAGAAISNLGGSGNFASHVEFGYTGIGILALLLIVTFFLARRPRSDGGPLLLIIVLYVIQTMLPNFRGSAPFLAALHPVNALLLFGIAAWYARRLVRAEMA
jgi:hypothetical protein